MPPKGKYIRCVDCRFRACTQGDHGWNGLEYCLNSDAPLWGQPIMYDVAGFAIDPQGCHFGKTMVFDNPDGRSATMNCIPPWWKVKRKR